MTSSQPYGTGPAAHAAGPRPPIPTDAVAEGLNLRANSYRILVTGSRTWDDESAIRYAFADIVRLRGPENVTIVHGACPTGADRLADDIARAWTGMTIERHPAQWRVGGRLNRAAGFQRNAHMVNLGADICLAFIRDGSRGASHTAALAEEAGIPVRRWTA